MKLNMYVSKRRNVRERLVSTFVARRKSSSDSGVDVDVSLRDSEFQEKQIVLNRGVHRELRTGNGEEKPLFHPNFGRNIAILKNDGVVIKLRNENLFIGVPVIGGQLKENEVLKLGLAKWCPYSLIKC
ncbi:hypothetical protein J437_LFUL013225 [Ladona fulva]|uniref:Uncharacterized protein n=1 Tax=Ladona fulva TaxID=123851 RepID=A0A8K0KK33_LADFU|nr:hypothetical protein J437_LFUL013225 [Ladona fulva]